MQVDTVPFIPFPVREGPLMSPSEQLEFVLPKLRRFARAAVGDRDMADACVEQGILRMLKNPNFRSSLDEDGFQFMLYRLVEQAIEDRLGSGFERQAWRALVLVHVEGFSLDEAARILNIDRGQTAKLIAAGEERL